ncbi:alpha/beta hydrolase [Actinospica acidithermotolerans]|nr:alpha/beta hydrolase-fold protein [Actinospica acidithermotolerans]
MTALLVTAAYIDGVGPAPAAAAAPRFAVPPTSVSRTAHPGTRPGTPPAHAAAPSIPSQGTSAVPTSAAAPAVGGATPAASTSAAAAPAAAPPVSSPTPSATSSTPVPISVPPPGGTADDGSFIQSETWLDPRMADLRVGSFAVGAIVPVRIIVPENWGADPNGVTWPVLYLLHGAHDDYTAWTRETDIESFVADKSVVVVMPEDGPTGIPTRWWNGGKQTPDYETFDAVELMQLLKRDFNASSKRAIAGVSTGGYGAIMMSAHYPGTFVAAASYSGLLNTTYPGMPAVMRAIVAREDIQPDALWGDPLHNVQLWNDDNPYAHAVNLRWTSLFISCGDGKGTSGVKPGSSDVQLGQTLEQAIQPQNIAFADRLGVLGIPVRSDFYSGGVHNWSSWRGTFAASWPMLAAGLGLQS